MIFLVIALVILIFGVLVFVHELGHFVAARRNGVEVEEFGFGFPPRLYGKKVGRTRYSINWIPLGGFVKLKGEDLNDTGKGSFGASSFWAKTKILFAGVTMNAALAYLILLWLCLTGLPPLIANQFSYGRQIEAQSAKVMAVDVAAGSPAADAGIARGSIISVANGTKLETEQQLLDFTKTHAGQTVLLGIEKGGNIATKSVTLRPADSKDGYLGVTPFATTKTRYSPIDAVITAAGLTVQLMWATLAAFGNLVVGLFAHGKVSDQVAGPVGIVVILANIVNFGAAYVLVFVASISISLAVINALPLPALDGGRWLLAAAQKVTKRQLSPKLETGIHAAGFFALIALMVVVTFFDIKRLG
jgi:regulator of sigma E protease